MHRASNWLNIGFLLFGTLETNVSDILLKISNRANEFENAVWRIEDILSRPHFV